jgi:hypothetical protein
MFEVEGPVGFLSVDVQYTRFQFQRVAGRPAQTMRKDGHTTRRKNGAIADEIQPFRFFNTGGKEELSRL